MKRHNIILFVFGLTVLAGCQKELSFEQPGTPADGSLQSDVNGDCLPKTVNGTYEAGTALVPGTNTITVDVNVTQTGTYQITTDTTNGYFFSATGQFTTTGINTVTLRGNGTPFASRVDNFVVSFDSTFCDIQVTVLPSGAGGPATFTIQSSGTPASCSGAVAGGNYIIGTALNNSNTVSLSVDVTAIGTYNISTTATNGMTFTAAGAFISTGVQTLVLNGSGTPSGTPGTITIPVTAGSSTCNFQVITVAGAAFSFDCTSAVVNGTYQAGTALGAGNTVDITVNVTTAGPYNISTTATNGMIFSASGTFSGTGPTNIQLTGSGTPTNSGSFNIPMSGTTPCSFSITCTAAPTIAWKFTEGTTTYQGVFDDGNLQTVSVPPVTLTTYAFSGSNVSGLDFTLILADLAGGINNGETYSASTTTSNSATLMVLDGFTTLYEANASISGLTFKATVTSHNTATKTITGTFSGTVKDGSGVTKTVSGGTFTGTYP